MQFSHAQTMSGVYTHTHAPFSWFLLSQSPSISDESLTW